MTDDLVTRIRALADTPHPTPQIQRALREAADALAHRESYDESEAKRAHDFENALGQCQAERDALKAKLAEWTTEYQRWTVENAKLKPEADVLRKERDEARAEASALLDEGNQMYRAITYTSGVDLNYAADQWKKVALSQPGPGAALLERVKKLEAVVEAARHWIKVAEREPTSVDEAYQWGNACMDAAKESKEALAALEEKP